MLFFVMEQTRVTWMISMKNVLNSDRLKGCSVKVITYLWVICFSLLEQTFAANPPGGDLKSLIAKLAWLAIVCSFRTYVLI